MRVLLTGANGYDGKRLLPLLVESGHEVVCLVRDPNRFHAPRAIREQIQIVQADLLHPESLAQIPTTLDVAFYLVHSMGTSSKQFPEMEARAAIHFRTRLEQTSVQQIIYLSGIANDVELSEHLHSRRNVEQILGDSAIPLTVLWAAIIIGSGSASFEIIRDLVEKLPVMITPKWLNTKCQPIAIRSVLHYLQQVMLNSKAYDQIFDIGGPDILTYKQMLQIFAQVRGYRRLIFTLPVLSPRLSSYWLYFVTSTSYLLAKSLVESMRNEVICQHFGIDDITQVAKVPYTEAIRLAFSEIEQNEVVSSWKDDLLSTTLKQDFLEYIQVPQYGCLVDRQIVEFERPVEEILDNIWHIGGERGWYFLNLLWKIRGLLDKICGGVGLQRGRRSPTEITTGDTVDFWRVILADKPSRRVLLFAEMKLPGEAWLEFQVQEEGGKSYLIQTATFRPRGLLGRLYWYGIYPLHIFVFWGMARAITRYRVPAG